MMERGTGIIYVKRFSIPILKFDFMNVRFEFQFKKPMIRFVRTVSGASDSEF